MYARFFSVFALSVMVMGIAPASGARADSHLPRFTEEREAAAIFFVKKQLPDLMPLLDELKKNNTQRYQQEIREIFQTTEMLADLHDEPRRHDLELKIWKAENRAIVLLARPGVNTDEERKKVQDQLRELARELVDLDMHVLEIQVEQLERELGVVRSELTRSRDNMDENVKSRYDALMEKARRPKK